MNTRLLIFLAVFVFIASCTPTAENTEETNDPTTEETSTPDDQSLIESVRATALPEEDINGRLNVGMSKLVDALKAAEGVVPDVKDTDLKIDENCLAVYKTTKSDGVWEYHIDFNKMETANGGFQLIPDHSAGEFPGLIMRTQNGAPIIKVFRDGKAMQNDNEWIIYLADRPAVEKVVPAILQSMNICQSL